MNADFTVFICGTSADLQEERRSVLGAVEALSLKSGSMEFFGARDPRPLQVCIEEVRASDIIIVIVGHRYGSIAPDTGVSFSEAEYRAAIEVNKPCYVFFKSDDVPLKPREMELDPDKLRLLLAWKKTLSERHTVAVFGNPAELAVRVMTALNKVMEVKRAVAVEVSGHRGPAGVSEVLNSVEDLLAGALDAGYPPGVIIGAIGAALVGFTSSKERLGVRIVILSGSDALADRRRIAEALQQEGADVWLESLDHGETSGHLTAILESAEVVIVLVSAALQPEPWLLRELEAAIWRFIVLPNSTTVIPVSIDEAAVPPLFRTLPTVSVNSQAIKAGIAEIIEAIQKYKTQRDAKGVQVVRGVGVRIGTAK
jgi:hypothetical protein